MLICSWRKKKRKIWNVMCFISVVNSDEVNVSEWWVFCIVQVGFFSSSLVCCWCVLLRSWTSERRAKQCLVDVATHLSLQHVQHPYSVINPWIQIREYNTPYILDTLSETEFKTTRVVNLSSVTWPLLLFFPFLFFNFLFFFFKIFFSSWKDLTLSKRQIVTQGKDSEQCFGKPFFYWSFQTGLIVFPFSFVDCLQTLNYFQLLLPIHFFSFLNKL